MDDVAIRIEHVGVVGLDRVAVDLHDGVGQQKAGAIRGAVRDGLEGTIVRGVHGEFRDLPRKLEFRRLGDRGGRRLERQTRGRGSDRVRRGGLPTDCPGDDASGGVHR